MAFLVVVFCCMLKLYYCQAQADDFLNVTGEAYVAELSKLEKDLLKNYSRTNRPVKDSSFGIQVFFYPVIDHIQELNEKQGKIVIKGALYMEWEDFFMKWNKEDYSNITRVVMYPYLMWRPNLLVYNAAENTSAQTLSMWNSHIWLYSSGRIIWYPTFTFAASCNLDFSNFPYDEHECPILVGPWSYNHKELEFSVIADKPLIWMAFNDSKSVVAGWELLEFKQRAGWWDAINQTFVWKKPTGNDGYYFPFVEITPRLKRHIPYFTITALLPSVSCSLLTILSFCISNLRNRAGLLAVNLILQIIFADDLLRILPPTTDNIPNIVQYFAFNLILTLSAIMTFVVMENMKHWNSNLTPVPKFLAIVVYCWSNRKSALKTKCKFRSEIQQKKTIEEETNVEDATTIQSSSNVKSNNAWITVVDSLSDIFFFIYIIVYFILMLVFIY